MEIPPVTRRPAGLTRDYIYKDLKSKIVNLELKPGIKISEKEISDISRRTYSNLSSK